jgi:signal transduction histidine kinase
LKRNKAAYWLYILGAYVIIQFIWWGYHLIQLSSFIPQQDAQLSKRIGMVIGEGVVFLLILSFGIYRIRKSITKEIAFQKQQQNFLLTVTHELKTPIAALKLYLQTLQKHQLPAEKKEVIVNGALQENERLSQLIENILNATKTENQHFLVQKQEVELVHLVKSILTRYENRYSSAKFSFHGPTALIVSTDENMLETILINLLENALKYGGEQVQIQIDLEKLDRFYALKVKDTGPGIPETERNAIFKKFYRIGSEETRKQAGSGLGLYIVAEYVRLLQGNIRCLENNPSGCIFELIIPL